MGKRTELDILAFFLPEVKVVVKPQPQKCRQKSKDPQKLNKISARKTTKPKSNSNPNPNPPYKAKKRTD